MTFWAASAFFVQVRDWLAAHGATTGVIVAMSIGAGFLSSALMFFVVARMSPDYFCSRRPPQGSWRFRHPVARIAARVAKNLFGLFFVVVGIAMLVLPGQGMLTILVGLFLLEFPGKRWLELRIVRQRPVLLAINWIRARARRPPLRVPDERRMAQAEG